MINHFEDDQEVTLEKLLQRDQEVKEYVLSKYN